MYIIEHIVQLFNDWRESERVGSQQDQEGGVVPGGHEGREKDEVWRFGGPCLVPSHEEAEREGKARKDLGGDGIAISAPAPF